MKKSHMLLAAVYVFGVFLRFYPRILIDSHLLTFQGDIWYRLAMSQYILDHLALPNPDLRYLAYGNIPMWYPPLSPLFLAATSLISGLDLPTVSSRIMPFIEALSPLSIFFLARHLYDETAAQVAVVALALTPTFVFWTGISDPQSLTLFLIPLYMLLWLKHSAKPDRKNVFILGVVLALNFLTHLSYFVAIIVLLSTSTALVMRKAAGKWLFRDLLFSIIISQVLTAPWWLPKNLYWWWIKALVTSSGLYSATWQIGDFGVVAFFFGIIAFFYIISSFLYSYGEEENSSGRMHSVKNWNLLLLLWIVPLLIESQNEAILLAIKRVDLTWTTLGKPLEGFRFFPYLAQPVAVAIGAFISNVSKSRFLGGINQSKVQSTAVFFVAAAFLWGIAGPYQIDVKFQTSGLLKGEYDAAQWYRVNSEPNSRIAADYYRAQMLSGVSGGKALDGGMFPLRNVDFPYISVPAVVQDDLYILYNTSNAKEAHGLAKKYGLTHIFYSQNMERYGNLLSKHRPASQYGVPVNLSKFNDPRFFELVYENFEGVKIFKVS